MARRKGGKFWDGVSRTEWLALFGNPEIMTDLMMEIFRVLYESGHGGDRAKNLAAALDMDYRGLNSAVGQAGMKIRQWHAARHGNPEEEEHGPETLTDVPEQAGGEASLLSGDGGENRKSRAPWEYVFDGVEESDGTYLWLMKPSAKAAWQEMTEAAGGVLAGLRPILAEDASSFAREESLFSAAPEHTVARVRRFLEARMAFAKKTRQDGGCCAVCGLSRTSLLVPEPYGRSGFRQKGLLFCPTHAALFRAHLLSFSEEGGLLVSASLTEEERRLLSLSPGAPAEAPFSKRRMAEHRRRFREEER